MSPERSNDEVYLLGCGRSMLDVSSVMVDRVNRAKCVIALNKYAAFYNVVGIVPTHIWFTEIHPPSHRVLGYIFKRCRRDKLHGLTFITSPRVRWYAHRTLWSYWRTRLLTTIRSKGPSHAWLVPNDAEFEYITHTDWLEGGQWARSLDEPLYQYRTSFTSALNYIGIRYPDHTVRLLGTDFNSDGYFFDRELAELDVDWDDWSAPVQREQKCHSAITQEQGVPVTDKFLYVREQLEHAGVRLLCPNRDSVVVSKGLAEYEPMDVTQDPVHD